MNDVMHPSGHSAKKPEDTNHLFDQLRHVLRAHVQQIMSMRLGGSDTLLIAHGNLDGDEIFETYLNAFATPELRQEHNCSCCRHFFRRYANVMVWNKDGVAIPLFFAAVDDAPTEMSKVYGEPMRQVIDMLTRHGQLADTPLISHDGKLDVGISLSGGYSHYNFQLRDLPKVRERHRTVGQNLADLRQTRNLFAEALYRWPDDLLKQSQSLFENDGTLARTKFREILVRFNELRDERGGTPEKEDLSRDLHRNRNSARTWLVVLTERIGVTRIAQSVLGQFLDDRVAGKSIEAAKRSLLDRIDPADYMRPTAAPSRQNLHNAERIVEQMGLKDSLRRRALRREDIPAEVKLWSPAPNKDGNEGGSVFGHLAVKNPTPKFDDKVVVDGGSISLAALAKKVIEGGNVAKVTLEFGAYESATDLGSWVTEAVAGSKPILLWDREDRRNPVSSYRYVNPVSSRENWGIQGLVEVVAVTRRPDQWHAKTEVDYTALDWVLAEGRDFATYTNLPLFPETLISELHGVRQVIEAFAKSSRLEDVESGLVFWSMTNVQRRFFLTLTDGTVVKHLVTARE